MENRILAGDMKYIASNFKKIGIFNNKRILITGCAGFLGYYFTQFFHHLAQNGVQVKSLVLLDNFMLRRPKWLSRLRGGANTHIHAFDIAKDNTARIKDAGKVDYIIHLASIASPTYYRKYPIQTIDANVWGLRNLLDFYKDNPLKGFLFFSSSEIYGDPDLGHIPTDEEYRGNVSCLGPRACYDEAKRFGETLCYVYASKYSLPICIVRPFNNYGPGMDLEDRRVPADFAKSIINNDDIAILSDGLATRTFCYVADAITGYLKALVYGKFDCFNIGIESPEISIKELARVYKETGKKLLNYNGKIIFKPSQDRHYTTNNPLKRCPDIVKARKLLKFNPHIGIKEGVERFLTYLRDTEACR